MELTVAQDASTIRANISKYAVVFIGLGVMSLVCSYISVRIS